MAAPDLSLSGTPQATGWMSSRTMAPGSPSQGPASTSRGRDEAEPVGTSVLLVCRARVAGSEPASGQHLGLWAPRLCVGKSSPQLPSQPGLAWHLHPPWWLHMDTPSRWFQSQTLCAHTSLWSPGRAPPLFCHGLPGRQDPALFNQPPLCPALQGENLVSTLYTKTGMGKAKNLLGKKGRGKAGPRLGPHRTPAR